MAFFLENPKEIFTVMIIKRRFSPCGRKDEYTSQNFNTIQFGQKLHNIKIERCQFQQIIQFQTHSAMKKITWLTTRSVTPVLSCPLFGAIESNSSKNRRHGAADVAFPNISRTYNAKICMQYNHLTARTKKPKISCERNIQWKKGSNCMLSFGLLILNMNKSKKINLEFPHSITSYGQYRSYFSLFLPLFLTQAYVFWKEEQTFPNHPSNLRTDHGHLKESTSFQSKRRISPFIFLVPHNIFTV